MAKRQRQLDFFGRSSIYRKWTDGFGGSNQTSHPKRKRPLSSGKPIHLVLKADLEQVAQALRTSKSKLSMLVPKNQIMVRGVVESLATRFQVRIDRWENVGNHIHLIARFASPKNYRGFIRGITSTIARAIVGATRKTEKRIKFWNARPFSRIVTFGRDFNGLLKYINRNRIQAIGFDKFVKEYVTPI